jgi:hypothetical protein
MMNLSLYLGIALLADYNGFAWPVALFFQNMDLDPTTWYYQRSSFL